MRPLLKPVKVPLDGIPSIKPINCTTQLNVICKLAEVPLNPTMALMKILNCIGPSMKPWGILIITGFHMGVESLTVTLCTWPPREFLVYLKGHLSNLYLFNLERRIFCRTMLNLSLLPHSSSYSHKHKPCGMHTMTSDMWPERPRLCCYLPSSASRRPARWLPMLYHNYPSPSIHGLPRH